MNWLTSIFGGSDTASKTMDLIGDSVRGVGNWIDEKDYTPEEKAKSLSEAVQAHLDLIKATANENSLRSVTRRWLAWAITAYILTWASVAMIFAILGKEDIVKNMIAVIEAFSLGWAFLAVVGLYFGVQLLRK